MTRNQLIFFLLILFCTIHSDAQSLIWASQFANAAGNSNTGIGSDIVTDNSGDVYITGTFQSSSIDMDPGPGVLTMSSPNTVSGFIEKLDQSGNLAWVVQLQSIVAGDRVLPNSIALDHSGNVLVMGYYLGAIDFDPGPAVHIDSTGGLFLLKLSSTGTYLRHQVFEGTGDQFATGKSFFIEKNDDIIIASEFGGIVDFDNGPNDWILNSNGAADGFVLKLDSAGNFKWVKQFPAGSYLLFNAMTVDTSGNIFVTGQLRDSVDFNPDTSATYFLADTGYLGLGLALDVFLLKLDSSGTFQWVNRFGNYGQGGCWGIGNCLTYSKTSNCIYATGYYKGTMIFDTSMIFHLSATDCFIVSVAENGNVNWAKQPRAQSASLSTGYLEGYSITTDADANVYTTGFFTNRLDFDPGTGIDTLNTIIGTSDGFILALDSSGNFINAGQLHENGGINFISKSLAIDNTGDLFITGRFNNSIDMDPGPATHYLSSNLGADDIFVCKLDRIITQIDEPGISSLTIFPNPARDFINITLSEEKFITRVIIYNLLGNEVSRFEMNNRTSQISKSLPEELKGGCYFVKVVCEGGEVVEKLIVGR
jgi:hypothetical protein